MNQTTTMLPGVGIFGTGTLAKTVVRYLKKRGFTVTAVWSRTLKDAAAFSADLEIPFYTNKADKLLLKSEVGFVVIVCTPHLQSPIAVKALSIGKHVIASWPAGTSQLEVLKMVKAASYYPSLLSMMCHGMRFLPSYSLMREKIESGMIGELFLFEVKVHSGISMTEYSWQCDCMMGGGALSMHGSYIIDTVSYLSGRRVKSVNGMVKTYVKNTGNISGVREITCDDFTSFQLELEDNITVSCVINTLCHGETSHEIIAVGSKGRLIAKNLDLLVKVNDRIESVEVLYKEEEDEGVEVSDGGKDTKEDGEDKDDESLENQGIQRVPFFKGFYNALGRVAAAFLAMEDVHAWDEACVRQRATFDDALHVQTVIDSLKQSSQSHKWVKISILDEEPDPNPHLSSVVRRSAYSAF